MNERLELITTEKKYFCTRSDCWKIPLNWNWEGMCENSCLKWFLYTKCLHWCYKNLQLALKCWVGSCNFLETISPSQFVVRRKATPLIIDCDYNGLEQAIGWRHLHAWTRSEVQQVKVVLLPDALTTNTIEILKWNAICRRSQLPKGFAAI